MKTNPRKKPMSEADAKRAWERGVNDGVTNAMAIILTVLVDKFGGADHIRDIWAEVNKMSEEIGEGRVSVSDLRYTLLKEYGIEVKKG